MWEVSELQYILKMIANLWFKSNIYSPFNSFGVTNVFQIEDQEKYKVQENYKEEHCYYHLYILDIIKEFTGEHNLLYLHTNAVQILTISCEVPDIVVKT